MQLSFAPVQEALGALDPKGLLHPLLTTLGTFEVSGACSRTFGSQSLRIIFRNTLQTLTLLISGSRPFSPCFLTITREKAHLLSRLFPGNR